jgi:hypothetical protein
MPTKLQNNHQTTTTILQSEKAFITFKEKMKSVQTSPNLQGNQEKSFEKKSKENYYYYERKRGVGKIQMTSFWFSCKCNKK